VKPRPAPHHAILADGSKCSGCHRCELACSLKFFGLFGLACSRIRIHKLDDGYLPLVCLACSQAPCLDVCPVNAREVLPNQAVDTDGDKCIGCLACLYICPISAPAISPETKKTMTCNLCAGEEEPWCVRACPEKALSYLPLENTNRELAAGPGEYWLRLLSPRKRAQISPVSP